MRPLRSLVRGRTCPIRAPASQGPSHIGTSATYRRSSLLRNEERLRSYLIEPLFRQGQNPTSSFVPDYLTAALTS